MDTTVKPEPQDSPVPPPSEYDALTVQLLQSPHQPDTWRRLVNVAEATGDISKISAAYDALLKQYPNTVCGGLVLFRFLFYFLSVLS
jgi:cleavage stimulation factor subunit 3